MYLGKETMLKKSHPLFDTELEKEEDYGEAIKPIANG